MSKEIGKCQKCGELKYESDLQESHDVPCYLFYDQYNRQNRKTKADKLGRHLLCEKCHKDYEFNLNILLKQLSIKFAKGWFK